VKSATKWVIVDRKRFETLVEDLRGFNDSLSALLPDIDGEERSKIAVDIRQSVNPEELLLVEKAAAKAEHDNISEVAGMRLTQITELTHPEDNDATISAASTQVRPVNVQSLVRQIEKLEEQMEKDNKGMMRDSVYEGTGKCHAFIGWEGARNDEYWPRRRRSWRL
jgi:ABC-type iron transport system FetAB ATPase subunit